MSGSTAASKADNNSAFAAPGIDDSKQLPRLQNIAIFVKGLEAYAALANPTVEIRGKEGNPVKGRIVGTRVGRLNGLANELLSQTPTAMLNLQSGGDHAFSDMAFYKGLESAYGKDAVHPLTPYTVLIVNLESAEAEG